MNFLKTMFAVLFAHRVMSIIITVVIGFILFYALSDLTFLDTLYEGITVWMNKSAGSINNWVESAIDLIKGKI